MVYAFVLSGSFEINGQSLEKRDGLGIWGIDQINIKALSAGGEILLGCTHVNVTVLTTKSV